MSEDVTVVRELQQAAPIVAELAANPEVVAALAVQGFEINAAAVQNVNTTPDPSTGFFGVYVEPTVEKVEQTVEFVLEEIKQEILTEVRNVEEVSKEGYVAAENIARKILNHHIAAGGGSVIKNPA